MHACRKDTNGQLPQESGFSYNGRLSPVLHPKPSDLQQPWNIISTIPYPKSPLLITGYMSIWSIRRLSLPDFFEKVGIDGLLYPDSFGFTPFRHNQVPGAVYTSTLLPDPAPHLRPMKSNHNILRSKCFLTNKAISTILPQKRDFLIIDHETLGGYLQNKHEREG